MMKSLLAIAAVTLLLASAADAFAGEGSTRDAGASFATGPCGPAFVTFGSRRPIATV
jgi:hypothetical protein